MLSPSRSSTFDDISLAGDSIVLSSPQESLGMTIDATTLKSLSLSPKQTRADRIPLTIWNKYRPVIVALYKTHTLKDVRFKMKNEHGFEASERQYKSKLKEWAASKYKPRQGTSAGSSTLVSAAQSPQTEDTTILPDKIYLNAGVPDAETTSIVKRPFDTPQELNNVHASLLMPYDNQAHAMDPMMLTSGVSPGFGEGIWSPNVDFGSEFEDFTNNQSRIDTVQDWNQLPDPQDESWAFGTD